MEKIILEEKIDERRRRRKIRIGILSDIKERKSYQLMKEEAEDRMKWKMRS